MTDLEVEKALADGLPLAWIEFEFMERVMVKVVRKAHPKRRHDGADTWLVRPYDRSYNAFVPACDLHLPTAEELLTLYD